MTPAVDLRTRFAPFFPIGDGLVSLEVAEPWGSAVDDPERTTVTVRLIVLEPDGRSVRDIKEQELYCGSPALYEDSTRVDEMLYAQQQVLGQLLRDLSGKRDVVDTLMPHDLLFTDVMTLVRARTREDFAQALRAKSRLGRLLSR